MASFRSLSPAAQAADNAARQARAARDTGMRRPRGAGGPEGIQDQGGKDSARGGGGGGRMNVGEQYSNTGPGGANPPGGRADQLRQAIAQAKLPAPLTPPTTTNGRVGSAPGAPTPVGGGETAFNGPSGQNGPASPGLLALAGSLGQAQGLPSQQGALGSAPSGSGGGGDVSSVPSGLAGMMGSMKPGAPVFNEGGSGWGGGGPISPGTNAVGGPAGPPMQGLGPANPPAYHGPWIGGPGDSPGPGWPGQAPRQPGMLPQPQFPTTNLGPIGNPPRTNPGGPGGPGGLHPSLGGFGTGMF